MQVKATCTPNITNKTVRMFALKFFMHDSKRYDAHPNRANHKRFLTIRYYSQFPILRLILLLPQSVRFKKTSCLEYVQTSSYQELHSSKSLSGSRPNILWCKACSATRNIFHRIERSFEHAPPPDFLRLTPNTIIP